MSSAETTPEWRTNALWGVLGVFVVTGTLGAATFVYGLTDLLPDRAYVLGGVAMAIGAVVTVLSVLFLLGILYRVDRYRGINHRRVNLFE